MILHFGVLSRVSFALGWNHRWQNFWNGSSGQLNTIEPLFSYLSTFSVRRKHSAEKVHHLQKPERAHLPPMCESRTHRFCIKCLITARNEKGSSGEGPGHRGRPSRRSSSSWCPWSTSATWRRALWWNPTFNRPEDAENKRSRCPIQGVNPLPNIKPPTKYKARSKNKAHIGVLDILPKYETPEHCNSSSNKTNNYIRDDMQWALKS